MSPTEASLLGKLWHFRRSDGSTISHKVRFLADGRVRGIPSSNEQRWELRGGVLALQRDDGQDTSRLEDTVEADGRHAWRGPFLADPAVQHVLEPVEAGSMAEDIMGRLYDVNVYRNLPYLLDEDLQGWNSDHPCFERLFGEARPSVVIDVGVWKGRSSVSLANLLRQYGHDSVVVAVDTFLGSPEHWLDESLFRSLRVRHGFPQLYWQFISNVVHRGCADRIVPMPQTSDNACVILEDLGIRADFIHIDAAHEHGPVLSDARNYWRILKPGGYLVGDDYDPMWPGVISAANAFSTEVGVPFTTEFPKWIMRKPM